MYLTHLHPDYFQIVKQLHFGLMAFKIGDEYFLVVKASKEYLLTAKLNRQFKIYKFFAEHGKQKVAVLITAFFDDADQPLVIYYPLLSNDIHTASLLALMEETQQFHVSLFNENNIEFLSYQATANFGPLIADIKAENLLKDISGANLLIEDAHRQFSVRNKKKDKAAITVSLLEPNLPEDMFVSIQVDGEQPFNAGKAFTYTVLEREEPGSFQEVDVVMLLQRSFPNSQIYLNPVKERDHEELADILVIGDDAIFVFQVKDSPNTEKIVRTTIERKRNKALSQVTAGAKQLKGAITELLKDPGIPLKCGNKLIQNNFTGKALVGVIVVKELFLNDYVEYSQVAFKLSEDINTPIVFFDFAEMSQMTLYCRFEGKFTGAIQQILDAAYEYGQYPRLRYSGDPNS